MSLPPSPVPDALIMWSGAIAFVGQAVFVAVEWLATKLAEQENRK